MADIAFVMAFKTSSINPVRVCSLLRYTLIYYCPENKSLPFSSI